MNNSKTAVGDNDHAEDHAVVQVEDDEDAAGAWTPDFHWLTDALAIGGRFPNERAAELASAHEMRAVVDLRAEESDDEAALQAAGIELLHLPTPDMEPARHEQLETGVAF